MELWHIPVLILAVPLAFIATVIIHEYGHWVGGMLTGYKTVYICFFSFVFYKDTSGKNRNARYPGMIGQCIMVPRSGKDPKPDNLIAGGPIMSVAAGIVAAVAMWAMVADTKIFPAVLIGMFATFNLTFGITNFIPRGTNDGANLKEVKKSDANRKAYNKVMYVYAHNVWGTTFRELPEELLRVPAGAEGSLADELKEYADIRKQSAGYMGRTVPEQEMFEISGEPDMKTGSWELWEKCRKDTPEHAGAYLRICREHMRKKELGLGEWRTAEELIMKFMELNNIKETA